MSQSERHLRRGVELRQSGRDEDALEEFREAYRLSPDPRSAGQLGLVLQALGQWVEAQRRLREAISSADHEWIVRNREALQQALTVVEQRVGSLLVRSNVAGAEIIVEGRVIATLPMREPVSVLAGSVTILVRASGYLSINRQMQLRGGEVLRETVELQPEPAAPRPPTPSTIPPPPLSPVANGVLRSTSIAMLVVGPVLLLGGVGAGVGREFIASDYNSNCDSSMDTRTMCTALRRNAGWTEPLAYTGVVVGSLASVGGVVLYFLSVPSGTSSNQRAQTTFSCLPSGDRFPMVTCAGRF